MRRLPLEGVTVLELGHLVAGPCCSLILADFGADVIKVERPDQGDQSRSAPGGNRGLFYLLNRNKRSLAIDLKQPEGREIFILLARKADVIIDNFAPKVLDRLGIGYEEISRENPGIIYCSIKGFLPGPYEDRPLLDELAQMEGGLAYMTGFPGEPLRAGASITDIGAATYGSLAIVLALLDREKSGRGQKVQSGLFETVVFLVGQHMAAAALTGEEPPPMNVKGARVGSRLRWGIYDKFLTSDGRSVFIGVTSDSHWGRFCDEFGLKELKDDARLSSNTGRLNEGNWLIPRVQEIVREFTCEELCEKLNRASIPFAPVNTPAILSEDKHLNQGGRFLEVAMPDGGLAKMPKLPLASTSYTFDLRRQPPMLGEDTREILRELGYSDCRISELERKNVILQRRYV